MKQTRIRYPYLPIGRSLAYVPATNEFMVAASKFAQANSLDQAQPTGSVVVANGVIIGRGANGSHYHNEHPCRRVILGVPTGQGYELCEGCHPKNHSERKAIDAVKTGPTQGADLYLWGHWWCCAPCWLAITKAGIHRVYLQKNSEVDFNRSHPNNKL